MRLIRAPRKGRSPAVAIIGVVVAVLAVIATVVVFRLSDRQAAPKAESEQGGQQPPQAMGAPNAPTNEVADAPDTNQAAEPPVFDPGVEMSAEHAEAVLKVPIHKWQKERVNNISKETLKETVDHLGNFDDHCLATTSPMGPLALTGSADAQRIIVTRLARVRRLLEEGRLNPDAVIPLLRAALEKAIAGWPEAYRENRARLNRTFSEPDAHMRYRVQSLAATYVLAELGDQQSLPLLVKVYRLDDDSPRLRSPVPPAITLYAMHRLVSSYPESKLSGEAARLRKAYLQSAEAVLPPPTKELVTKSWTAAYDESDPRIMIMDPRRRVLGGQAAMTIAVYPSRFMDKTWISDPNGQISERAKTLFAQLERFVQAVGKGN